ncbi:IS3 family transposase [Streptomyces sp. NPDC020755]|uniref:IS3 family transposase n=1 Tax=Streptomyces sp. NPDC020755 TaxID=3154790 RepID=UPI0033EB9FA2
MRRTLTGGSGCVPPSPRSVGSVGYGGTYGSPKVWLLLLRAGWRVSVNTVARLMVSRACWRASALTDPGRVPSRRARTAAAVRAPLSAPDRAGAHAWLIVSRSPGWETSGR